MFGKHFAIQLGKMLNKKATSGTNQKPYLANSNVRWGNFETHNLQTMHFNSDEMDKFSLRPGDLIVCEGGEVGRAAVWDGRIAPCYFQKALHRLRPIDKEVDVVFARYFLDFSVCTGLINSIIGTTSISHFTREQFLRFPIWFPTVEEQKLLVTILSTWERAIEEAERLLALKQRRKRALMQQLLTGQQRFPEFAKSKGTQDTLLGPIAVDWPLNPISTVFERVRRKNGTSTDRVLTASGQHGLVDQRDYFDRNVAGVSLEGYYVLERGEFAYNRSAMKGYPYGAIKRLDARECGAVSTLYHCFGLKDRESDSDFFMHLFEFGLLNRQLRRICQVGGRAHGLLNVTAGDFEKMLVPVPSKEEQVRIAGVLNKCDEEIEQLKAQLEALKKQKKGLMQQLLTGRVRVAAEG